LVKVVVVGMKMGKKTLFRFVFHQMMDIYHDLEWNYYLTLMVVIQTQINQVETLDQFDNLIHKTSLMLCGY